ncbi:hypothetical protein BCR37DRAFT_318489 [Protomyces lactucae-debilis]|uniref:Uncharacterized protein n=1 Tax=Protomyces lactucae-debilis TaxID=2754530 RepID=A0A1Y2FFA5_PROLT|nr:uncharacterized protein BCR37DRAFT_318489 [Protomyces lactucae-debilis]ORY82628.1 hypothetical protein BCR37DRAFT_318489 [Protomyces lactucae-debilis]
MDGPRRCCLCQGQEYRAVVEGSRRAWQGQQRRAEWIRVWTLECALEGEQTGRERGRERERKKGKRRQANSTHTHSSFYQVSSDSAHKTGERGRRETQSRTIPVLLYTTVLLLLRSGANLMTRPVRLCDLCAVHSHSRRSTLARHSLYTCTPYLSTLYDTEQD